MMRSTRLLPLTLAFLTLSVNAADRVLDFSSGCKIYRLENKTWAPEDSAAFDRKGLSNAQIVKDEAFTVFRTSKGTYGVNQKCVKTIAASAPSVPAAQPQAAPRARPVARRQSAGKPRGPSLLDNRGKWAASIGLGMNISPKGNLTITNTTAGTPVSDSPIPYSGSITFAGEISYRASSFFRLAAEIGLSQLQESSTEGNETSFFALSPEIVVRGSPVMEYYFGPTLGLFFLSENASVGTLAGNAISTKQQTATSTLIGVIVGADYALTDQFDIGLQLRYFKPGSLKVQIDQTTPTTATYDAVRTASYMMFGARFQIHF